MGLKTLPASSGELLFEIILRRHEVRSTIMTSNRPVDEWGKLLGDVPAAGTILDRLLHHAEVIAINGRSHVSVVRSAMYMGLLRSLRSSHIGGIHVRYDLRPQRGCFSRCALFSPSASLLA